MVANQICPELWGKPYVQEPKRYLSQKKSEPKRYIIRSKLGGSGAASFHTWSPRLPLPRSKPWSVDVLLHPADMDTRPRNHPADLKPTVSTRIVVGTFSGWTWAED
jgi:hypothetical protein